MRRAVLRSNYTRRGSLSRTLNLRNALFLHREKSASRWLNSVIIIRFRRGQGNYFARARVVMLYFSLSFYLPLSLSLSFSQFATLTLFSVDQCQNDLYPVADSFLSVIFQTVFPAGCENLGLENSWEKKNSSQLHFLFACSPFHRPFLFDQYYHLSTCYWPNEK